MRFRLFLIFSVIIFVSLSLESVYAQAENVVLLYKFDQDTGDTAKDLSPQKNDGIITEAKWTKDGKFGGGLEFNGETSLIEVPHHESLNPGGEQLSIISWFKPLSFPAGHPPIARKGPVGAGVGCWGFDTPNGTLRGFVYLAKNGQAAIAQGASTMELEEWNHVAMVYDGKEIRVYLNGKLDGSVDAVGDININEGTSVWIGKKANENIFLHGILDELGLLNLALTEAQIETSMTSGIKMAVEPSSKLARCWGEIKSQ